MSLRTSALGAIMVILIPWTSTAADLTPRQLKKSLKQADKSWKSGQVARATELYEGVLNATSSGAKERQNALYALGLLAMAPDSQDLGRAKQLLTELADSFPNHNRGLETRVLLSSLDSRGAAAAEVKKAIAKADQQREGKLRALEEAQTREREESQAKIAELQAKLEEVGEQAAAEKSQSGNCQAIEQELEKAKEHIQKLARECSGG